MKISINWIKEFVDLSGISVEELIARFNLSTAEIEDVHYFGGNINNVVLAKILEVNAHPQSQKLHILKVDDGTGAPVQVVCGAPNVKVGMVTAFARVGAVVNGININKAKLAGVESFGMCCGESELGIGSDESGIMELEEIAPMGTNIKTLFPIDDVVFEVDNKSLTNRPDLWGHYGIAREFATIFNRKLTPLKVDDLSKYNNLPKLSIKVESKNCYRYSGITVNNVNLHVSPLNMKIKLNYCGMRDINLLADITNYLMLEVGQPMHAFDNEIVKGIVVTEPNKSVNMVTLEGENHEVKPGSVVICDEQREPVAIAGVKGGLKSGISENTTSLLLESATFDAVAIRKSSKAVGLATDASARYEKSLDPELTTTAIARLLHILKNIDKNITVTSSLTDVYNYKYPTHTINFDYDFIERRSGVSIEKARIKSILQSLGFEITESKNGLQVVVPSWRGTKDVSIKEDLVEEILRIYGYDNIVPTSMSFELEPVKQSKQHILEYKTKRLLAEKYEVNEVHTYVWNYADFNKSMGINEQSVVTLLDTSNSGQSGIRKRLAPSLLKVAYENIKNFADIRICEIGRVAASLTNNVVNEETHLCVVLASSTKSEESLYFELKTMLQNICGSLINTNVSYVQGETSEFLHPVNSCVLTLNNGIKIGEMGVLYPTTNNNISQKHNMAALEINFAQLCNATETKQERAQFSKFQSVALDLNFLVPNSVNYAMLEKIINEYKTNLIMEYYLKDIYENSALKDNKSYTFAFTITPTDKTLTNKDIETFSAGIIAQFKKHGINLRA